MATGADVALPMMLEEFLRWDDGTETRYELIGGVPRPIAPSFEAQRILVTRLIARIEGVLVRRRPAITLSSIGVIPPHLPNTFLVADIAATRAVIDPWRQAIEAPFLVLEVLSPSSERRDRRIKLPAYRQIDSVEEIALVASDGVYAELHRRDGPRWISEICALRGGKALLELASVPLEIPLADLYKGIAVARRALREAPMARSAQPSAVEMTLNGCTAATIRSSTGAGRRV